jgi:hypothetical protein
MDSLRVKAIAGNGVLGSGFRENSLLRGMALGPDFIGCDAGSTDPGPYYLGAGKTAFPRAAVKRDLSLLMKAARSSKIPLIIGSAGTAGGRPHVENLKEIALEIASENKMSFKLALIDAEQDKSTLTELWSSGKITPISDPGLDYEAIQISERVVGMMGVDPFISALNQKADIIIAGRSSDCAIYAALPIMKGIDPAVAWHAAKILECGAAAAETRSSPDCLFAELEKTAFEVEPLSEEMICTPQSVAAHSLYENANPFELIEPDGILNIAESRYHAVSSRRVRITNSSFEPKTIKNAKLEGAIFLGYQSVIIGGIRDPLIIGQIDDWAERLKKRLKSRVHDVFGEALPSYHFNISIYGKNAVMGDFEPTKKITSHELGVVLEITSESQEISNDIISLARHQALHLPIPEWSGLITGFACRHSPPFLERGKVYKFSGDSLMETANPLDFFPCRFVNIVNGTEIN